MKYADPIAQAEIDRLTAENDRLRRWKAEAAEVLMQWESAYVAAGEPGSLGSRKSEAMAAEVKRLRGKVERVEALLRSDLGFGLHPSKTIHVGKIRAALADPEESDV